MDLLERRLVLVNRRSQVTIVLPPPDPFLLPQARPKRPLDLLHNLLAPQLMHPRGLDDLRLESLLNTLPRSQLPIRILSVQSERLDGGEDG